jgi:hypothetical protein
MYIALKAYQTTLDVHLLLLFTYLKALLQLTYKTSFFLHSKFITGIKIIGKVVVKRYSKYNRICTGIYFQIFWV